MEVELWKHQTGFEEEAGNRELVERFNASQQRWRIVYQSIPQRAYTESVIASALAGKMPCVLTVDQPKIPSFVWAGHLQPLDGLVPEDSLADLHPGAIGRYRGRIYSVGQFDAALAIYARRSVLEAVGARIPTVEAPWTRAEFDEILVRLSRLGQFEYAIDLQTRDNSSDWWTYAYSPLLQSFGGDLIDRSNMTSAEATLNSAASVAFGEWFKALFDRGLANRKEPDEFAFQRGRVGIVYTGNWWAPAYRAAYGDDLLILPPPNLGNGTVIGGGSWQWAISSGCSTPDGASEFIRFLSTPREIAAMSIAAGMIPVSEEAAAMTDEFRLGGSGRQFFELMRLYSRQRPVTPAFASISTSWHRALRNIVNGADVRDELDDAVDAIEAEIEDNRGFAFAQEQE